MASTNDNITKFKQFDQYNFDTDNQFQVGIYHASRYFKTNGSFIQSGVASLLNNKQENEADLLLRAKLFYYTK